MKKSRILIFILIAVFLGIEVAKISLADCLALPNEFYVSYDEINDANAQNQFGRFVKLNMDEKSTAIGEEGDGVVIVKLFGFIPIKKIKAKILPSEEVFIGGELIGLDVTCDGMVVVSNSMLNQEGGDLIKNSNFKNGDVVYQINDQKIDKISDISSILQNTDGNAKIGILRNNELIEKSIQLLKDEEGRYKLGVWGKEGLSGVGTLTFVKQDLTFGALGHAVTSGENVIPIKDGNVYSCNLIGIKKGERNNPGELRCVFVPKNEKGEIYKNTKQGIYGKLNSMEFVDPNLSLNLGGRLSVKPGKAKIISSISGVREEYEIEIIKANSQSSIDEKSIVFRVLDERLLSLTGGIVQGMSGSPIIQNDKIVGAVTHVFLNDPTKGYGVYTDWMLMQMEDISEGK